MAKEDAPTELNVRLEWPEVESPAVTKRRLPARVSSRKKARSDERALLPRRRGRSGATEAPAAQVDTRARMASALSAPELNQLSTRVEELAGAVGDHAADARLKRTSADLRTLTKRVDSLTRAVAALPNGAALAELVGRVDTLAHTVELLCEHIGSGAHRFDPVEHQIDSEALEPGHRETRDRAHDRGCEHVLAGAGEQRAQLVASGHDEKCNHARPHRRTAAVRNLRP